jgi:gliding motility-associated-like protein
MRVVLSYLNFTRRDTVVCDDSLILQVDQPGGNVVWSTGDTTASIVVFDDGVYWTTVSNNECFSSDTIDVSFNPVLLPNLEDTFSCTPISIDLPSQGFDVITWNTGDTAANLRITESGSYWVRVEQDGCTDADTFDVVIDTLGYDVADFLVCDTDAVVLPASGPLIADYQWSTGDTIANPVINAPGVYRVTITTPSCAVVDTVEVIFGSSPNIDLGDDLRTCAGASTRLSIDDFNGSVVWNTGDTTNEIQVTSSGRYQVSAISEEGCVASDSVEVIHDVVNLDSLFIIANVITPNGDGVNDVLGLRIVDPQLVTRYKLTVYNRWGVLQFDSDFLNHDWDGRTGGGALVEPGTYYYIFKAETRCTDIPIIEVKDNVTVLY